MIVVTVATGNIGRQVLAGILASVATQNVPAMAG